MIDGRDLAHANRVCYAGAKVQGSDHSEDEKEQGFNL